MNPMTDQTPIPPEPRAPAAEMLRVPVAIALGLLWVACVIWLGNNHRWMVPASGLVFGVLILISIVSSTWKQLIHWKSIVAISLLLVAVLALFLPKLNRANGGRPQCGNHLRQIGLALQNYHSEHGSFPPPYFADEHGQPMHSWRVMILPYVENKAAEGLYEQYRWDESWNSPHNLALTREFMPEYYACTDKNNRLPGQTNYFAITGPGTAWDGGNSIHEKDVTDGLSHTFAVCDLAGLAVHWSEPRDVSIDQLVGIMHPIEQPDDNAPRPSHTYGTNFLFLDDSVHFIQTSVPANTLRAMSTIASGEEFNPPF